MNTSQETLTVTKGNGKAIHIAKVYEDTGNLATLCDAWGASGAHSSRIRPASSSIVTCKSCLRAVR